MGLLDKWVCLACYGEVRDEWDSMIKRMTAAKMVEDLTSGTDAITGEPLRRPWLEGDKVKSATMASDGSVQVVGEMPMTEVRRAAKERMMRKIGKGLADREDRFMNQEMYNAWFQRMSRSPGKVFERPKETKAPKPAPPAKPGKRAIDL